MGYDPGTGKQIQKSITGKTQSEVAKKLKEATASLDTGTYIAPNKTTVSQWMDTSSLSARKGKPKGNRKTAFEISEESKLQKR